MCDHAQPFYIIKIFISGSFSDLTDLFVFLAVREESLEDCQTGIDLLVGATAVAVAQGLAALGAKTGAVVGAEDLGGEHEQQLFEKLVVDVETAVHHDSIFSVVLLNSLAAESLFVRHSALEVDGKSAAYGREASGTFRGVVNLRRKNEADIATLVGHVALDRRIAELHTGYLLGNESIINGDAVGFPPK